MTYTVTELTDYTLEDDDEFWGVNTPQGFIIGSKRNRPVWVTFGKVFPVGVLPPLSSAHGGTGQLTATHTAEDPEYSMTGKLNIKESLYRELTDEESNLSLHSFTFEDLGSVGRQVTITSSTVADASDLYVSHRIFHLNYVTTIGEYRAVVMIPYTGGSDAVTIDIGPDNVAAFPLSPTGKEWSIIPAGATGEFAWQRLHVGRLTPRALDPDTQVELTETDTADGFRVGTATLSGGTGVWLHADITKGIVDETTGNIVAYIDRRISATVARIIFADDMSPQPESIPVKTARASTTYTQWHLSGDHHQIYYSAITTLGAGGNVRYHHFGWDPVNVLRTDALYTGGARLERLVQIGDELMAIYSKGIAVYQGGVSIGDPASLRQFIMTEEIGTVATNGVWKDARGALWVWGSRRLLRIQNGIVEDASLALGYSRFWGELFDGTEESTKAVQACYNPETNTALLVGALKVGESTDYRGWFAAAICHDSDSLHPLRWPRRIQCANCFLSTDGRWEFMGGGKDRLYQLLVRETWTDSWYDDAGTLTSDQGVSWWFQTGVYWYGGTGAPKAARMLIESSLMSGIDITLEADVKRGNIFPGTFTADASMTMTHAKLNGQEFIGLDVVSGYGVQYKVSGTTSGALTLVALVVAEDVEEVRGWKELAK